MKYIFFIILVFYSFVCYGQDKVVGIINDPDGYVNLRIDKSSTSEIVGKIEEGQKFYYYPVVGEQWWRIESYYGSKTGFVHSSRISNYYVSDYKCQCDIKRTGNSNPNYSFKIGESEGSICGYLLQRISDKKIKISEFSVIRQRHCPLLHN